MTKGDLQVGIARLLAEYEKANEVEVESVTFCDIDKTCIEDVRQRVVRQVVVTDRSFSDHEWGV